MTHEWLRAARLVLGAALLLGGTGRAAALVGATAAGSDLPPHYVMVLTRAGSAAGFCTGIVVAPDVVLTAAHCVGAAADTRVHLADAAAPALLPVAAIAVHPLYRADAVRSRQRSLDVGLIRLVDPLPRGLTSATFGEPNGTEPGATVTLAGFGLAAEAAPRTGGTLRRGNARVRAPRSDLLLWLEGPSYACTGDSGGAVLDGGGAVVGIVAWAGGNDRRGCGALTQAIRVAAARAWIDATLSSWRR